MTPGARKNRPSTIALFLISWYWYAWCVGNLTTFSSFSKDPGLVKFAIEELFGRGSGLQADIVIGKTVLSLGCSWESLFPLEIEIQKEFWAWARIIRLLFFSRNNSVTVTKEWWRRKEQQLLQQVFSPRRCHCRFFSCGLRSIFRATVLYFLVIIPGINKKFPFLVVWEVLDRVRMHLGTFLEPGLNLAQHHHRHRNRNRRHCLVVELVPKLPLYLVVVPHRSPLVVVVFLVVPCNPVLPHHRPHFHSVLHLLSHKLQAVFLAQRLQVSTNFRLIKWLISKKSSERTYIRSSRVAATVLVGCYGKM